MAVTTEQPFWGTHFTSAKLLFYSLFWSVHIALFAAGWYVKTFFPILAVAYISQVHSSIRLKVVCAQHITILRLDIERLSSRAVTRCHANHAAHVSEYP